LTSITLTKHHGLGNDFLVWLADVDGVAAGVLPPSTWPALARRLCDRRRGIGADGLLIGTTIYAVSNACPDVTMTLHNADGSLAEMSGNGIRCFAQAVTAPRQQRGGELRVLTGAGERVVTMTITEDPDTIWASVSMGAVTDIAPPGAWSELSVDPLRPVAHVSLGNPHSVVAVDDVAAVNLAELGSMVPNVNLEIIEPGPEPDAITMRVHERGAGLTEACGTGACASAHAAARWGLVHGQPREITVHMDGGDAKVRLDDPPGEVTLIGPATYIATIRVDVASSMLEGA
jgi:diaminopimelate epimerase